MVLNNSLVIVNVDDILIEYQPQYEINTMRVVGLEILSRVVFGKEIFYPESFIPYVIKTKQSSVYFIMIMEKAIKEVKKIKNIDKISINVNVSALTLGIENEIYNVCSRYSYSPKKLNLELTEDENYHCNSNFFVTVDKIFALGVSFSMDDFGKENACLNNFVTLPFTEIKIDRLLVSSCINNEKSLAVIVFCLMLGEYFDIRVVAEGVENIETLNKMRILGVDICQGYYLSRPLSIDKLKEIL